MGTKTITGTVTLVPSGYTGESNVTIPTSGSYAISNAYKASGNTSNYCRITVNTSTTGYFYLTFDTSEIPAGATITGISGKVTVRVSSTNRVTNTVCQLYAGTTAKGSNVTFASTSTSNTVTLSPGTGWTRADLNNLRLRIGGTGSSSTQTKYIYLYGADLEITYSVTVTTYDVTISNSTSATVTASDTEPLPGDDVTITADTLTGLTVTDNGVDVTSQFVQGLSDTVTQVANGDLDTEFSDSGGAFYISSSSSTTSYLEYAIGYTAEDPGTETSTNTYVKGNASGNTTTGDAIYSFDFSDIPAGATIKSVSVKCYAARENATVDSTHVCRIAVYSGSTLKGAAQDLTSTSYSIVTLSNPGSWTRQELQNAKFHFTLGYYGGRIAGITWTVEYEVDGYVYTIAAVAEDHTIVVAPSGGGGNPPVITVNTPSRTIISDESGFDQCVCTFSSDLALAQWEARATKAGTTPARGVGLLVESGGPLAAGATGTVTVDDEELTQGDGEYTITVYGQSTGGVWSE